MTTQDQSKEAEAIGFIQMKPETIRMIREEENGLGNVVLTAEEDGRRAAGKATELIPHIRPTADLELKLKTWIYPNGIEAKAVVKSAQPASIESEALLAVTACLISIFEGCRPYDASMVFSDIRLLRLAH